MIAFSTKKAGVQSWTRFYGQLDYIRRHYRTALPHLTPRKLANAALNEWEYRRRKTILRSKPLFIKVEPTPLCQLRCPGCWHGATKPGEKKLYSPDAHMSTENFIRLIDPLKDTLLGVSLSWRGDAFNNTQTINMLRHCKENNLHTSIPSNMSYKFDDDQLEAIVDSGLDHLIVALDGFDAETYMKYRRGGKFDQVLDNCRRMIAMKRRKRVSQPVLEWKFIVFDYNVHQIESASNLSKEMGFDRFSTVLDFNSDLKKKELEELKQKQDKKPCYCPFRCAVISWDELVIPCCDGPVDVHDPNTNALGHILESDFDAVWNAKSYQEIRKQVITREIKNEKLSFRGDCSHF